MASIDSHRTMTEACIEIQFFGDTEWTGKWTCETTESTSLKSFVLPM